MGKVFLAEDKKSGKKVALKFLLNPAQRGAHGFFREEVKTLAHLSHPHLVKIFDYYDSDPGCEEAQFSGPYFTMEFIPGDPLHQVSKTLNGAGWTALTVQLLQGLHYLHSRNILHRDLKPSNVLLTASRQIKILDFGLATTNSAPASEKSGLGTLAYLAPEVFLGEYDAASDLFSLGVLLFECLAGKMPFPRPLVPGSNFSPAPALGGIRPDFPEYLCGLVDQLLQLSPSRRPRSALALLRFINHHVETPFPLMEGEIAVDIYQKIPLVGREPQQKVFREAFAAAKERPSPSLIQITGATGSGRSRFVEECKWEIQLQGVFIKPQTPKMGYPGQAC